VKLSLCVLTFKRDDLLYKCLQSLDSLDIPNIVTSLEVIVVDNDGGSRARTEAFYIFSNPAIEFRYHHEEQRGISFARNAAITAASPASAYLLFIDDDEIVDRLWLSEMLTVACATGADVVTGDVKTIFPVGTPDRIVNGQYFERQKHADREFIDYARTGNVLIRRSLFAEMGNFDASYAISGGEDMHFFRKVHRSGYKICWAANAIVEEFVDESRTRPSWLIRRWFRTANTEALVTIELAESPKERIEFLVKGGVRAVVASVCLPIAVLGGFGRTMRCMNILARGAGYFFGAVGGRYLEYR
jgi:succinoglycan biosynthesis protein ExoM